MNPPSVTYGASLGPIRVESTTAGARLPVLWLFTTGIPSIPPSPSLRAHGSNQNDTIDQHVVVRGRVGQLPALRNRTSLPKWLITTTHRVCRRHQQRRAAAWQLRSTTGSSAEFLRDTRARNPRQVRITRAAKRLLTPISFLIRGG